MSKEWKIYTKKGDKGETSLLGGTIVSKFHDRVEAYGTLDELNSFIGLIRDLNIDDKTKMVLIQIQNTIFTIESHLAADSDESAKNLPIITEVDVKFLEDQIDNMNDNLPYLSSFILPGGHQTVSYAHIVRTITRRAERVIIKLSKDHKVDDILLKYINRLSDYFFVLARKFSVDFNAEEIPWKK